MERVRDDCSKEAILGFGYQNLKGWTIRKDVARTSGP